MGNQHGLTNTFVQLATMDGVAKSPASQPKLLVYSISRTFIRRYPVFGLAGTLGVSNNEPTQFPDRHCRCGCLAARLLRTAAGDAGDWVPQLRFAAHVRGSHRRVPRWLAFPGIYRGPQCFDR